jgi:hypothetical protein
MQVLDNKIFPLYQIEEDINLSPRIGNILDVITIK